MGRTPPADDENPPMATVEVSRTLVKSLPELWAELEGDRLCDVVGGVTVCALEPERVLRWEGEGASGAALLEPSSWGTKVTLTAKVDDEVSDGGLWERLRRVRPISMRHADIERRLSRLLDDLGSAQRRPFSRD